MSKKNRAKTRNAVAGHPAESNLGEGVEGGLGDFGTSGVAIQQTVAEDPLAKFVQHRWRELVTVLVVVFVFFYGKDVFQKTRLESLRRSADILLDLQSQVEQLKLLSDQIHADRSSVMEKEQDVEKEQDKRPVKADDIVALDDDATSEEDNEGSSSSTGDQVAVDESLKEFNRGFERAKELSKALAQERSPYSELSEMYSRVLTSLQSHASVEVKTGDVSQQVVSLSADAKGPGMLAELEAFHAALLLANTEGKLPEAVRSLENVVQQGQFAGSAALVVLFELSKLNEDSKVVVDKEKLKNLAVSYLQKNPDQTALVQRELPQLF